MLLLGILKIVQEGTGGPSDNWDRFHATLEPTKRTGNTIVVHLQRFHSEHGRNPERLDELVPAYLPAIPRPVDGEGFFYSLNQDGYLLTFGFWFVQGDLYPRCTWDSRDADWHVEQ
jgi:hypothetical protein